jgi:hypothetical protein
MIQYPVVGTYFRGLQAQNVHEEIQDGWLGFLEKEPTNEVDPLAAKVIVYHPGQNKFWWIGYLPRGKSKHMEADIVRIIFDEDKCFSMSGTFESPEKACEEIRRRG